MRNCAHAQVSMHEDHVLATAFASAQRTSSQEVPEGTDMMQGEA